MVMGVVIGETQYCNELGGLLYQWRTLGGNQFGKQANVTQHSEIIQLLRWSAKYCGPNQFIGQKCSCWFELSFCVRTFQKTGPTCVGDTGRNLLQKQMSRANVTRKQSNKA